MKIYKYLFIHCTLCISLMLNGCSQPSSTPQQVSIERGDKGISLVARELELKPIKTYEDLVELGNAYLWMGEDLKAAEAYEVAAQQADSTSKLVGALYNKAGALAYAGYMEDALRTTDFMVKLSPENIEVAKLRCALYRYSGNQLGLMAAADHLATLDPSAIGEEVMDPVTGAVIIASVIAVATTATTITAIALVPPEDRKEIVVPIMNGYAMILGKVAEGTGPGLSSVLLQAVK